MSVGEDDEEKRIVYDDEAISQLLDRSKEAQEEKEMAMNEYFDSFKVASYTVKEGESDVSSYTMILLVFLAIDVCQTIHWLRSLITVL